MFLCELVKNKYEKISLKVRFFPPGSSCNWWVFFFLSGYVKQVLPKSRQWHRTLTNEPFSGGKESACNAGDPDSIPGSGRSPGEGNGNPLQCSCLENPRDGVALWAAIYGVAQSRTRLKRLSSSISSTLTPPQFFLHFHSFQTFIFIIIKK